MTQQLKSIRVSLICGVALFCLQAAHATQTTPFSRDGEIHELNAHLQNIVINDVRYILPHTVKVYLYDLEAQRSNGQYKGRDLGNGAVLRKGMHIGFNVIGEEGGKKGHIVEAWILPPGSIKVSPH